jgi:hypothetical protein
MSLLGFDILRKKHPADSEAIAALELEVARELRRDPEMTLDERVIAQLIKRPRRVIERFMIELVGFDAFEPTFQWICPVKGGDCWQGEDIKSAPLSIECELCDDVHELRAANIEVHFVASTNLRSQIGQLL